MSGLILMLLYVAWVVITALLLSRVDTHSNKSIEPATGIPV